MGLSTNPNILRELLDRLQVGCIIFELPEECNPGLVFDQDCYLLLEHKDKLVCTVVNTVLRDTLQVYPEMTYSLKNMIDDFPEILPYLKICEKKKEAKFSFFIERLGKAGAWINGEFVVNLGQKGEFLGLMGIFKDTTLKRELENQVNINQSKLEFAELILEISQKLAKIGTWRLDLEKIELSWTDTLYQIYDVPKNAPDLVKAHRERIPPEDYKEITAIFEKALETGSSFMFQYRIIKRNGDIAYLSGNGHPEYSPEGKIIGYFGLSQDISDLKNTQKELEQVNKNLEVKVAERTHELELSSEKMKVVLEQLTRQNEQLQQYTYIVSHNLRAPVANITGLAELFDVEKISDPENHQIVQHIQRVSKHLDHIIKDLNEILSVEGEMEIAKVDLNLPIEINRVCDELQAEIKKRNAKITIQLNGVEKVRGVKSYIYSILHNLVENALKYRQLDRQLHIEIGAQKEKNGCSIWVHDNGIGIDLEKNKDKLFNLRSRINGMEGRGLGMGLYLVKSHLKQMGGEVSVESIKGKGTNFKILLPY